ncbi:MAG: transcriptional regulator [Deltaproteobacteria bacterium HGW-Deltaproteobacteria-6]|jgi:transcriptional regulator with XRE-family HTH domain|nr:MAG: transcriptional regulator [Deltaproteobacteria bacterium HGW-Deltaproteobacteria-6]
MENKRNNKRSLLGRRIREIRISKSLTQEKLGSKADISYKFVGEIERGLQNPSFETLEKIAEALDVELYELFRFEHESTNRKDIEARMTKIVKGISEDDLRQLFFVLRGLYPHI